MDSSIPSLAAAIFASGTTLTVKLSIFVYLATQFLFLFLYFLIFILFLHLRYVLHHQHSGFFP